MRIAYDNIRSAIQAVLAERAFSPPDVHLMPVEPPRDWGVSTNVCFLLGPQAAKDTIELETEGLGKKEAKQVAQRLAREGGEWLAQHLAEELAQQAGTDALPYVARVEAEGAYVNFYYDVARLTAHVVETINKRERTGTSTLLSERASDVIQGGRTSLSALNLTREKEGGRTSLSALNLTREKEGGRASLPAINLTDTSLFGHGAPTTKRIMVEYAQPNTHKDFHVGHLRNASIGQAIANLLEFAGNDVLKATYIGDIGAHVAKAMFGNSKREDPEFAFLFEEANQLANSTDRLAYWGACYKGANKAVSEEAYPSGTELIKVDVAESTDKGFMPKFLFARTCIASWLFNWEFEKAFQHEETRHEWLESREECLNSFKELFIELRLEFSTEPNCWFLESIVDQAGWGISGVRELQSQNIAEIDRNEKYKGAIFVDFEKQAEKFPKEMRKRIARLGKMTILRSEERESQKGFHLSFKNTQQTDSYKQGLSLYQTKELGLAKYKFDLVREKYGQDLDESLYVVGAEQNLYFQQVFAILRLWGFPNAENCKHISYELVTLPEGKMSSREGTIVSYRELRDEAVRRAEQIARDKGIGAKDAAGAIDEAKVKAIAHDVAIAAIKFAMLKVTGSQQIVFDFEEALSFSGRSAPYLQYAYARAGKLVGDECVAPDFSPVTISEENNDGGLKSPTTQSSTTQSSTTQSSTTQSSTEEPPLQDARPTEASPLQPGYPPHPSEAALARLLSTFPSVCREAAAKYEPATICTFLYDLATAFSDFYRDCRVLDAPEPQRTFRRALTSAFRRVTRTGFKLLALPLPEEM